MMKDTSSLNRFPKVQIKPYDGMSITADVWAEAHAEHRQTEHAHNLFLHGTGIITGLEVVANDPPDKYVFISPGIAIDTGGNVIELTEPVAYDFGNTAEGPLYLLLGHGEREVGGVKNEIRYCQNEFVIAARSNIPKRPSVELARATLSGPKKPLKNAENPLHPGLDEIDLRFRKEVGPEIKRPVRVALCNLGQGKTKGFLGWDFLSRECERASSYKLILDPNISISEALFDYQLVFLMGEDTFQVSDREVSVLDQYLDQGKKLIIEAHDEASQDSFQELLEKLNRKPGPIEGNSSILTNPFLFNSPPEGMLGDQVLLDPQVIYTTAGYSLAWTGKAGETQLSRSDIRTAHEWGVNMIIYCLAGTVA
jgi:hypothetical protein